MEGHALLKIWKKQQLCTGLLAQLGWQDQTNVTLYDFKETAS
jgi:hypothetical protein